jgi:hypothetical protein
MATISFTARLGEDGVIRVPAKLNPAPGPVKVTVTAMTDDEIAAANKEMLRELIEFARANHVPGSLPSDLAENHDHYLHGLPKGIDRP